MKIQNLQSLSGEEVKNLNNETLAKRMDEIRLISNLERYGSVFLKREKILPIPKVIDILETRKFQEKDYITQRRILDAGFRYLMQLEFLFISAGITNSVVYGKNYSEKLWNSPAHWMKSAVLSQYEIIASRIALECLFDLFYLVHKNERMKGKSKFATFRKWILEERNPYQYFISHFIAAFKFDREHRQAEVHGTSRFTKSILRLEPPSSDERNISSQLTNILLNVWSPFIEILRGENPNSISVFDNVPDFPKHYFERDEEDSNFQEFILDLVNENLK